MMEGEVPGNHQILVHTIGVRERDETTKSVYIGREDNNDSGSRRGRGGGEGKKKETLHTVSTTHPLTFFNICTCAHTHP